MAISTVCLRNWPNLDVVVTYALLQEILETPLYVTFGSRNLSLSDDEMADSIIARIYTIGVGKGYGYEDAQVNGRTFGSETSLFLHSHENLSDDSSLRELGVWMDRDVQDGRLTKKQPYSIGWIMHQAFRLGHNHTEVVNRAAHVVRVLIDSSRAKRDKRPDLGMHEAAKKCSAMALLSGGDYYGPFTVRRYIRDMYMLGYDEELMVGKAGWFVHVHNEAKRREAAAKKVAETAKFDSFLLSRCQEFGTWVEAEDPYLMSRLGQDRDMVVMRNPKGNIIIMSRKFDLSDVAVAFVEKEPNLWYFDSDRNILANGTESEPAEATALSRESLQICIATRVKRRRF